MGGLQDFSVSPSPLLGLFGLELGWTGLGLGLEDWGLGLDKKKLTYLRTLSQTGEGSGKTPIKFFFAIRT